MKSILLASVASIAFAGVAAAEVTFSGSATLGYNDNTAGSNTGFYGDLGLDVNFSQELDNGITVAASIGVSSLGATQGTSYELSITSETAGLYVGDTDLAADKMWSAPDGMDVGFTGDYAGDYGLRGEVTMGGVAAALSYSIDNNELNGLQVAANGTFGSVDVGFAYQDADNVGGEVMGISAGASLGGADVSVAYATETGGDSSTAIGVSYPAGPVTLGAYYGMNAAGDAYGLSADYASGAISVSASYDVDSAGADSWGVEGSYDVGNGVMVMAGVVDSGDDFYVAGTYDLGGGASLLVSYADDKDGLSGAADDEIGDPEYQQGATVEVSFAF